MPYITVFQAMVKYITENCPYITKTCPYITVFQAMVCDVCYTYVTLMLQELNLEAENQN